MNKKTLAIVLVTLTIAIVGYRILRAPTPPRPTVVIESETNQNQKTEKNVPSSLKINPKAKVSGEDQKTKDREFTEEDFKEFDQIEKNWLGTVELIIGEKNYPRYLEMRNQNEKEKMQAYKEYHDYLRQKYGDTFSYNISEDQSIREKQINQRYLKELLELIGPEAFKKYTDAKDLFNENMRRENKESIQMEF